MLGVVEQVEGQGSYLAGAGGIGPLGALQRLGMAWVEEDEANNDGHDDADTHRGDEPAHFVDGDRTLEEEPEKEAHEHEHSCHHPARAKAPEVGADGQDDGEQNEADDPVSPESDSERQCRDHGNGEKQSGDQLALGPWVDHAERRDHPDDGAHQHDDDQVLMVGQRHLDRFSGGEPGAAARKLQRVGEVHEQPLGLEDRRDGDHTEKGAAEAVEARIGPEEAVDPCPATIRGRRGPSGRRSDGRVR